MISIVSNILWFFIGCGCGVFIYVLCVAYVSPEKLLDMRDRLDRFKELNDKTDHVYEELKGKFYCDVCHKSLEDYLPPRR